MATELHIDEDWYDRLQPRVNEMIVRVAKAVRDDARKTCPVDTGALKESLTVLNSGVGEARVASHLPYCAAVELGFHGEEYVRPYMRDGRPVRGHSRQGNTPAQPFLRPALYRTRDLSGLM